MVNGEFSLTESQWNKYPSVGGVPKPQGPFRLVEGDEYQDALQAKNSANAALHRNDPSLDGKHLHEIHPVKFGGSPTDPANKVALDPQSHVLFTNFWAHVQRWIKSTNK